MRKLVSIVLCLVMLVSCFALFASANIEVSGEDEDFHSTNKIPVQVIYQEASQSPVVCSVDVAFGSMMFTYSAGGQGIWNPDTNRFDGVVSAGWSFEKGSNEIVVANHSNAAMTAAMSYDKAAGCGDLVGTFDKPLINLASAVNTDVVSAPADTAKFTVSGAYKGQSKTYIDIGTVTVTITKA